MSMDAAATTESQRLRAALGLAQERIASVEQENKLLRQKIELLIKKYFGGQKSEAIDAKQLEMLLAGLVPVVLAPASTAASIASLARPQSPRSKPVRQPLPPTFRRRHGRSFRRKSKPTPTHGKRLARQSQEHGH